MREFGEEPPQSLKRLWTRANALLVMQGAVLYERLGRASSLQIFACNLGTHHGFRVAAEYLHRAQPNLGAQAKRFQEIFGVHLCKKGKNGRIRLTETRRRVWPDSITQGVLDASDEAIGALISIERGDNR